MNLGTLTGNRTLRIAVAVIGISLVAALAAIFVFKVAPGTVLLPDDWNAKDAEHLNATTPLQRSGTPDDVAAAMLFLLESDYITGDVIIVDGGRHVRGSTT